MSLEMAGVAPQAIVLEVRGPIAPGDLPGLCARVCALLAAAPAGTLVLCDVRTVDADAVAVDALARLQLAAGRHGCRVAVDGAGDELRELVAFVGLADALPARDAGRPAGPG